MPIDIHIDLSPRQKRLVRGAVVAGAVIGALGIGVAIAMPKHTFVSGTPVSAADMNDNFVDLDTRVGALGIQPSENAHFPEMGRARFEFVGTHRGYGV